MKRAGVGIALAVAGLLVTPAGAGADVKTQQKSLVKFEGMMGWVAGRFGGKAAKDGTVSTVAVKGDRKATFGDASGEIVDLAEEKVYQLNLKDKTYKVLTFDEIRKQMEEAAREAEREARKGEPEEAQADKGKEMTVDFDVKSTGQKRAINGFDCREVIVTIAVHEKGQPIEKAGGFVMTMDSWMAPKVAGLEEVSAFDARYASKLSGGASPASAQGMVQLMAMYPQFAKATAKLAAEQDKLQGTPILTVTRMETVASPAQADASRQEGARPSAGGVMGGMLGRFGRKKAEPPKDQAAAGGPERKLLMTTTTEVLGVSPAVAPGDLAIPAGFRQK